MDASIKRQKEKERRERLARAEERQRQENLKTESAQPERQRVQNMLMAYQESTYSVNLQKLFALDAIINKN